MTRWLPRRSDLDRDEGDGTVVPDESRERARRTGDVLRQARTERGITLAEVEQDIRINRTYLEALENARFDLLPAPVYARGFMRSYARYLALDPDEAVRAVPRDLPRPADLDPMPGLRRGAPSSLPSLPSLPALNRPMAIGVGAAVLVLLIAIVVVPRLGGSTGVPTGETATPTATAAASLEAPNLVGAAREAATGTLERAGLVPLVFPTENTAPAGTVIRQSPAAGATVKRGDVITLFVSQGPGGGSPTPTPTPSATPSPTGTARPGAAPAR